MSETDKVRGKFLIQFTRQMKKKGLYAAGMGGGANNNKINLVDVVFDVYQVMDIESARKLIVESTNSLLEVINSNTKNKKYFDTFPVTVDVIMISIIGQVPDIYCEYIRSVSVIKKYVYYCTDDPEKKIMPYIEKHEETFEEAQKILSQKISL